MDEQENINYQPHPLFKTPYDLFWELRNTKGYDHPINHLDIKALIDLYEIELQVWEIRTILALQITWYESQQKHKV